MSNNTLSIATQHIKCQQTSLTTFATLLNDHMQHNQVSEKQLADALQLHRSTIKRWLNGDVHRPRQRQDVLRCATYLSLTASECQTMLLAAGFPLESVSTTMSESEPVSAPALSLNFANINRSPFVVGPPITEPRQFFGRDYFLKRIFDIWQYLPLQHIAIVGAKRSGKTSLLHYLRKIIDTPSEQLRPQQRNDWLMPGYQWVFVDFQDPRMCYQETLLRHLLMELGLPIPEPCDLVGFMEVADQNMSIPTLILLDEISAGLAAPELDEQFWWGLRSLGSNHAGGKIGFVMTAHEPPEELILDDGKPSPFFNIFGHVLNLGPLDQDEAHKLICSSPEPFAEADVEWILEHSGLWPALIQITSHACLIAHQENTPTEKWRNEALRRMQPYRYLLEQTL